MSNYVDVKCLIDLLNLLAGDIINLHMYCEITQVGLWGFDFGDPNNQDFWPRINIRQGNLSFVKGIYLNGEKMTNSGP